MAGLTLPQVLCAGHSLGAALAGLCGVWASNQYPSADVLTVVIGQVSFWNHPNLRRILTDYAFPDVPCEKTFSL